MNEVTLGPYAVGEQPNPVIHSSYNRDTGQRRNLTGYAADCVLRKPNDRNYQLAAQIIDYVAGDVKFDWPINPFDMAGNWDLTFWVSNGTRRFRSAIYSFRVAPSGPAPTIVMSEQDGYIDGGSPSDPNAFDGGAP